MSKEAHSAQRSAKTKSGHYTAAIIEHYIQAENVSVNQPQSTSETAVVADLENSIKTTFTQHTDSAQKCLAFAIAGGIDQVDETKLKAIVALLQKMTDDSSIEIITLILGGSPAGLEKLKDLHESGELTEVLDTPIEDVHFVSPETSENDDEAANKDKSRLIQEIITQAAGKQDLRDADLSVANLSRTNLSSFNLVGANLSHTNLSHANLSSAIFNHANLSGADLSYANLSGANLSYANLNRANLRSALINQTTVIAEKWRLVWELVNSGSKGHNPNGADLSDADLSDAELSGADLSGADLSGADLSRADLSGADLSDADLSRANLKRANLSRTNLHGALINQATVIAEKWRLVWELVNLGGKGHNLSHADLSNANLSGANHSGVNLNLADLSLADLSNANLSGANLSRAYLSGAYLSGAYLSGANLSGAYLSHTDFNSAVFSGAIVQNARFTNSLGISKANKTDLRRRGAIFDDLPGDLASTHSLTPH